MAWGMYPMRPAGLPHGCETYEQLMDNLWDNNKGVGSWIAEPKMDGVRCLARVRPGMCVELLSRHLKPIFNLEIGRALAKLSFDPSVGGVFDGELYNGEYRIFDAPMAGGNLWERCAALGSVKGWSSTISRVDCLHDTRVDLWDYVMSKGYEGLVLKHWDSTYNWTRSPRETTTEWIKVKP